MKNVYKLRGASLEVYAALYAMTRKKEWHGTYTTLEGYLDMKKDTLRRAFTQLEKKGLLSIENIAYSTYAFQALHPKKAEMAEVAAELKKQKEVVQNEQVVVQNGQEVIQNGQDSKESTKENINIKLNKNINLNYRGGAKAEFCPPRWEEIYNYSLSKLIPIETAKQFYCYYEANGWRMSKGCAVRKWQALLMKWDIDNHVREKEQAARAATRYQSGGAQLSAEQASARSKEMAAARAEREESYAAYEAERNDPAAQAKIEEIQKRLLGGRS